MSDEEKLDDLEVRVENLEDITLKDLLIEFCLKGRGSDVITKEELLNVLNKGL